ncbi:MAG: STT3 domain-containing protein [Candidatus Ranarchaeia archaeon]
MKFPKFLTKLKRAVIQALRYPTSLSSKSLLFYSALGTIVVVAFVLRLSPLWLTQVLLKEFDPYSHYRSMLYILDNGILDWFSWHDAQVWYPWGRNMYEGSYPGVPLTAALLYLLFQAIGLPVTPLFVAWIFPAIMGTLAVIVMYFLGKEVANKKVGMLSSLFLAFSPGYIQRTVAGFFDTESVGVLMILLTLYFFFKSYNDGSFLSGILAGCTLGYLAASWGAYIYIFDFIALLALIVVVLGRYNSRFYKAYTSTMGIAYLFAVATPRVGATFVTSFTGLPGIGMFVLLSVMEYRDHFNWLIEKARSVIAIPPAIKAQYPRLLLITTTLLVIGAIVLQIVGVLPLVILNVVGVLDRIGFTSVSSRFISIIFPLARGQQQIISSVGEHLSTPWGYYFFNLHALIVFVPVGLYFLFRKTTEVNMALILLTVTIVYFSGSMIRIILIMAPIACLVGAIGIVSLLQPFADNLRATPTIARRRRKGVSTIVGREASTGVFVLIALVISFQLYWGIYTTQGSSYPEILPGGQLPDWLQGLEYVKNQLPEGTVVASWWDYGYWITTNTNKTSLCDNATANTTQIGHVGYALMETNQARSVELFRQMDVDYVLVHFGMLESRLQGDEGKWIWMVRIAEDVANGRGETWIKTIDYYNETNDPPIPDDSHFYNSTLYKLLRFDEPGGGAAATIQRNIDGNPQWSANPVMSVDFFEMEFFSEFRLFKLYKIDYDAYDAYLNVTSNP